MCVARLQDENAWLRTKAIKYGAKLAKRSSIKVEPVLQPAESDGFHYGSLPEPLEDGDLVKVRKPARPCPKP
jgi:hypothetical protein